MVGNGVDGFLESIRKLRADGVPQMVGVCECGRSGAMFTRWLPWGPGGACRFHTACCAVCLGGTP